MVTYKIPHQARFLTTANRFSSVFNSTPGGYLFTGSTLLLKLQPATVYFINTLSVGGNISEEIYLDAVQTFPLLHVNKKISNAIIYEKPLPISNYFDGNEASTFVISDKYDDELLISFEGVLRGTAALVGISPVTIQVQFNIFAIESSYYAGAFRDQQNGFIGQSLRD